MRTQISLLLASTMLLASAFVIPARAAQIKNVVIVHGALADGSGWRKVFDLLTAKGYKVTVVQPPMTSLQADVEATKRILDLQDGPSVLVGHSYGGMIITEAGNADNVAGLVYIAAFQPDAGETLLDLASKIAPATKGISATSDNFLYLDPKVYAADFAADVPKADAEFMAHSQVFPAKAAFETKIKQPGWKTRKSWALIATDDRAINPDLMRFMAKRAGSKPVEVKASHAVFMSQPAAVANLIDEAAKDLSK
ncbi:alpha/beta fold hydrolase [Pseudorhodoplanes sinuspersici]|uniref:Alpha/beta hydrolase n=1 Tax=Pseudorhodoplanes sinuspersici TaxID=1235591 RepID=A0A1W6ZNH7_9HYPH|nr:alpha/beta hydrolase [Pseudorhodoplanes sinuspersici]RKE69558.1 pimeloyl-ACP methyl ester carboxylesterase [Pseudorhodoplanes sinuspersici]